MFKTARAVGQRIHNSQVYAFTAMTLMGLCSGFFCTAVLDVFPTYWRDAYRYGLWHINAVLASTLLFAMFIAGGSCLAFCGFYYGRLAKE
jgi:hypothetical protein